jgi:hypothetical protein
MALRRTVACSSTNGRVASILAMEAVIDCDSASFCWIWRSMEASFASCSEAWARIDDRVRATSEAVASAGAFSSCGIAP